MQGGAAVRNPCATKGIPEPMVQRHHQNVTTWKGGSRAGLTGASGVPTAQGHTTSLQLLGTWWLAGRTDRGHEAHLGSERLKGRWKDNRHSFPEDTGICLILRATMDLTNQFLSDHPTAWLLGPSLKCGWEKRPPWEGCLFTLKSRGTLTTASTLLAWDQLPIIILLLIALDNNLLVFDGRQTRNLTSMQSFFFFYYLCNEHVFLKIHSRGSFPSEV